MPAGGTATSNFSEYAAMTMHICDLGEADLECINPMLQQRRSIKPLNVGLVSSKLVPRLLVAGWTVLLLDRASRIWWL